MGMEVDSVEEELPDLEFVNEHLNAELSRYDELEKELKGRAPTPPTAFVGSEYDHDKIRLIIQTYFAGHGRISQRSSSAHAKPCAVEGKLTPKTAKSRIGIGEELSPIYRPEYGILEGCDLPLPDQPVICPLSKEERFYLAQTFDYLVDSMKTISSPERILMVLNAMSVKLKLEASHPLGPPKALSREHLKTLREITEQIQFIDERNESNAFRLDFVRSILLNYYREGEEMEDPLELGIPGFSDLNNPTIFQPHIMLLVRMGKEMDSYNKRMWSALVEIMKLHGTDISDWSAYEVQQEAGKRKADELVDAIRRGEYCDKH